MSSAHHIDDNATSASATPQLHVDTLDGVGLQLEIAGLGARSYAYLIDWHIRILVLLVWFLTWGLGMSSLDWGELASKEGWAGLFGLASLLPMAAFYFLYHPVLEWLMQGRTPGKRMAGIRIVKLNAAPVGLGAVLLRNIFRLVDSLPFGYAVGITSVLMTRRQVRVGDLAAGCLLVYEDRTRRELLAIADAPAELSIARQQIARELLNRWSELNPQRRVDLGARLAEDLPDGYEAPPAGSDDAAWKQFVAKLAGDQ